MVKHTVQVGQNKPHIYRGRWQWFIEYRGMGTVFYWHEWIVPRRTCDQCGKPLAGWADRWCSDWCRKVWHSWQRWESGWMDEHW